MRKNLSFIPNWYFIKTSIFTEKPLDFKMKILLLKNNIKHSCQQQPCET